MKPRIHFHSDCAFFAGCENMLVNFWSSPEFRARYDISFSYRDSPRYRDGMLARIAPDFPVQPLLLPEPSTLLQPPARWPAWTRRLGLAAGMGLLTLPSLLYDVWRLWRLLRRTAPDLLHINNGGYPATLSARAAALAGRLARVPLVVMVVNNIARGYDSRWRRIERPLDRWVVRAVTRFITGSRSASQSLRDTLGLAPEQCVALHNGIALRATTESVEQTRSRLGLAGFQGAVFGMVAVMEPRKGHKVLLTALRTLQESRPDLLGRLKVVVEGDGPLRVELEDYVRARGLGDCCLFIGSERNVANLFAALDVLILPSLGYEDFPNVVLEAMGFGKAVIASRLAGTPEQVVEAETGLLVEPGDSAQLAGAIARVAEDPELTRRMGRNGRQRFESLFTAEAAVRRYLQFHDSLLEAVNK